MHPRERIEFRIGALRAAGQWRDPADAERVGTDADVRVDARSNDYLGLAQAVSRETVGHPRAGAGASRLITGTHPEHLALEAALADWLDAEGCLLFSSGYAANVGVLSALAGPGETVFSDSLNHASIIDGCRLSRATVVVLPHRNLAALERALADSRGVRWVVTESYFGMDGDVPDLRGVRKLCDTYDAALIVDEAHALGVFGPSGRGLCAEAGVVADVAIGGMGKAFGVQGGFAACSRLFRAWLWNRARSFVFSTAPSPVLCVLALRQLAALRRADAERARLVASEDRLSRALCAAGVPLAAARRGPIFPIVFGAEAAVLAVAASLAAEGVLCQAIRPPTVSAGSSRLRVTLRADMSDAQVDLLAHRLVNAWRLHGSSAGAGASVALEVGTGARQGTDAANERNPRDTSAPKRPDEAVAPGEVSTLGGTARAVDAEDPAAAEPDSSIHGTGQEGDQLGGDSGSRLCVPFVPERHRADAPVESRGTESAYPEGLGVLGAEFMDRDAATPWGARSQTEGRAGALQPREESAPRRLSVDPGAPSRWLVLGTGTGVGKSFVAQGLVRQLAEAGFPTAGLKPVETGLTPGLEELSDASQLGRLSFHVKLPARHPLYSFAPPIAPARAARAEQRPIEISRIVDWVAGVQADAPSAAQIVVETAGGVFSPLGDDETNFDLARALDPAIWLLVAPDRLGVLHDVTSCLRAMESLGRRPNYLILSAPEHPDASTGTNAEELARRRAMPPILELPRNDLGPLSVLFGPEPSP